MRESLPRGFFWASSIKTCTNSHGILLDILKMTQYPFKLELS